MTHEADPTEHELRAPRGRFDVARFFVASPETLAAFRVAVSFAILASTELHAAPHLAALPPVLRIAPEGLGWFAQVIPIAPSIARAAEGVAMFGAAATLLGVYTRAASVALFVATFYLLALGQLGGTVIHDMHLVWFAAILAASPCADVLSVDAWWARREGTPLALRDARRYGIPVWTARLLFACIYFFPGLHKVVTQGLGWASADNLALQLQWKWFEWGEVPPFRFDQHPALLTAGGASALAFELGFPLLLLTRRTRIVAAVAGVAFHLATERIFRIPFSSLWLCYPVLFDWRGRHPSAPRDAIGRLPRGELAVYALLVAGALIQGARGEMRAFPFACYPTFQYRPSREAPDLRIVAVGGDDARAEVPHARDARGVRSQAGWGRIWALAGVTAPTDRARLLAYVTEVEQRNPKPFEQATSVEVRRAFYDVTPEASGKPPRHEELLATFRRDAPLAPWR